MAEKEEPQKKSVRGEEPGKVVRLAVIRIRGDVGVNQKIKDTLKMLHLYKKNRCIVIPATPSYRGMIAKVKDYCTFGEIDEQTFIELLSKRGRLVGDKPLTEEYLKEKKKMDIKTFASLFMAGSAELKDIPGLKPFFKLHPPIGGFEIGGIKKPYSMGGALGYRGEAINKLLRRMI